MNTDETSVPIWSVSSETMRPPTQSTTAVAIRPSSSMPGKKTELSSCAYVFVRRLASFAESNSARKARSRLNACMTAMPETDSAICAVIDGDRLAHAQERGMRLDLEPAGQDQRRRQDDERDEPEAPVEDEEAADRREQRQRVDDECRQSLREDVGEGVDVRGEARDDPAGLLLREVAQ